MDWLTCAVKARISIHQLTAHWIPYSSGCSSTTPPCHRNWLNAMSIISSNCFRKWNAFFQKNTGTEIEWTIGLWRLVGNWWVWVRVQGWGVCKPVYPVLHQWLWAKMTEQFREEIKCTGKTKCEGARLRRCETWEEMDVWKWVSASGVRKWWKLGGWR